MENIIALSLNVIAFVGMQLVWFEGDQTGAQLPFFGLLVANVLLTAGVALRDSSLCGVFRATGTFFLILNLEAALCLVPSTSSNPLWNIERKQTAYTGGVMVLIAVLASFAASYTGCKGPAAGAGSRIASLRGLSFLLAAAFFLIASAVQWSWTQQCNAIGRPGNLWYPVTNGVLIVVAFIFVIAVVYGDNDTQNISVFLAATMLLAGFADPLFDSAVDWPQESNFKNKWRAAKGLSFIGVVVLLLSVFITGKRGKLLPSTTALPYDLVAFAIAFAGAICVFVRNPEGYGGKQWVDYAAAFAIVITVFNLLQGLLGFDAGQHITTFFAAMVLNYYDIGSTNFFTGYVRGGLQLCQGGVLLSILVKAFPADKPLLSYIKAENKVATGFGLLWLLLAMLMVPSGYSKFILIAIINYRAMSCDCADWKRTTFYILSFYGVAGSFPLRRNNAIKDTVSVLY